MNEIIQAYLKEDGAFYLCKCVLILYGGNSHSHASLGGPTWPVPDVTNVLEDAIAKDAKMLGNRRMDPRKEIEKLKDQQRYVLEVY